MAISKSDEFRNAFGFGPAFGALFTAHRIISHWFDRTWVSHRYYRAVTRRSGADVVTFHRLPLAGSAAIGESAPIWTMWFSLGDSSLPPIIDCCVASQRQFARSHPHHLLTAANLHDYVQVPDWMMAKVRSGTIPLTAFSEFVRFDLLSRYGGIWLDAAVFLDAPLPTAIDSAPFWSLSTRPDRRGRPAFLDNCPAFVLAGTAGDPFFTFVRDALESYWRDHDLQVDYFLVDSIMKYAYRHHPYVRSLLASVPYNNPNTHGMLPFLERPAQEWDAYAATHRDTHIFKLNNRRPWRSTTPDGQVTLFGRMVADRARERAHPSSSDPGESSIPGGTNHPSESTNPSKTSKASKTSETTVPSKPSESAHHAAIAPTAHSDGTPLVSIIVPVYNARASLHRCFSSITTQTYAHLEIILIDDGSDDGSGMYCDLWTRLDSRIRVIHQRNAGASAARNRGIGEARGDYLMFVDADDTLLADAVETVMTMIALAQRTSASVATDADQRPVIPDMVSFDFSVFRNRAHLDRTNVLPYPYPDHVLVSSGADCLRYVYQGRIGTYVWSFLYSTRFLRRCGVRFDPKVRLMEDTLFLGELLPHARQVRYLDVPIYHYHIGERNTSGQTDDVGRLSEAFDVACRLYDHARSRGMDGEYASYALRIDAFLYAHASRDRLHEHGPLMRRLSRHMRMIVRAHWHRIPWKRRMQYILLRLHWYEPLWNSLPAHFRPFREGEDR